MAAISGIAISGTIWSQCGNIGTRHTSFPGMLSSFLLFLLMKEAIVMAMVASGLLSATLYKKQMIDNNS